MTRGARGRSSASRSLDLRIVVVGAVVIALIIAVTTLYALGVSDGALYLGGVLTGIVLWWSEMLNGKRDLAGRTVTYAPMPSDDDRLGDPWQEDTNPGTVAAGRPGRRGTHHRDPTLPTRRDPTGPVTHEPVSQQVQNERDKGKR